MARRRRKTKRILVRPFLIVLGCALICAAAIDTGKRLLGGNEIVSPEGLASRNAVLMRLDDEEILMEKNAGDRIYPASMTKIMTVLIAIEEIPDLSREVSFSGAMFRELYASEASMAGYLPGEEAPAADLLYGAMLPSGAECCVALAEYISGSEEEFAELMNQKARELGMDGTHFVNSTGLHDEDHYTTAKDMAGLVRFALQNDMFRGIFTAERHFASPTGLHPGGMTFYSSMFGKIASAGIKNDKIIGGKTGYTEEAGLCLASLARVGGEEYVLVTAGAEGDSDTPQYNITDALMVYGMLEE